MAQTRLSEKKNITIDDVRPPDRVNGYPPHVPRWYTKLFEVLPAFITWFFLFSPILFALIGKPDIFMYFMGFFTLYWSLRGLFFMTGISVAFLRMRQETKTNWMEKIKQEDINIKNLKFVLIYPLVHESFEETIRPALQAWTESTIGSEKITIVFALEEKFAKDTLKNVEKAKKEFGNRFATTYTFIHPNDIEGEVKGVKGANINWATRLFVEEIEAQGQDIHDYLLITCDSDQRPDPQYLAAISYKYNTVDMPDNTAFTTAVHTFNNNIWRVPVLIRVMFNFITVAIMYRWGLHGRDANATFSAYVVNLETVKKVHYWDPQLENDDTAFYWNARTRLGGKFKTEAVYVPTHNDAVENETYVKSHKSLWKQQLRWGWGTVVFPMGWAAVYKNHSLPLKEKARMFMHTFDDRLLFRTAVYLITFGIPILTFLSPGYEYHSSVYLLPKLMSTLFTVLLFFNLPIIYIRRAINQPPKDWSIFRHLKDIGETILIAFILLTYGFMPTTQAQTQMIFRKGPRKEHYATEKVAIKKS